MLHMKMSAIYLSCYGRRETGVWRRKVWVVSRGLEEREGAHLSVCDRLSYRHHGAVKLHIILTLILHDMNLVEKVAMNTLHKDTHT